MTPLTEPQRRTVDDAVTALRGITRQLATLQESLEDVPGTGVVRDAIREARRVLWVERATLANLVTTPDPDGPEPAHSIIRDTSP